MQGIVVNVRILRFPTTGVQRYTLELLSRFGDRVERVAPAHNPEGVTGHLWEQIVLPFKVGKRLLWSPSNTGPLMVKRQVVTIHDISPIDHPEWLNPRFADWYRFLIPRLAIRVRGILTVSDFMRQRMLEVLPVPEEKIYRVHLGVDSQIFSPRSVEEVRAVVGTLGIPSLRYFLYVGSLAPGKNVTNLLRAWAAIAEDVDDEIWLVLAGSKGKSLVFKDIWLDRLPPRVFFTGHVPTDLLPALYSGAIGFVFPSLYESFGLPPLEAMSCGAVPVVSNCTAMPEVVGDAGILVDPKDVESIAWGIRRLVDDDRLLEELRSKGLERAKQFSWDKSADLTWKVLQEVAEKG